MTRCLNMLQFRRGAISLPVLVLALAGCEMRMPKFGRRPPPVIEVEVCDPTKSLCPEVLTPDEDTVRPQYRKGGETGDAQIEGTDSDALDATSDSEKAEALEAGESSGEMELGRTIASLGDVTQQGFWLKTPMVIKQSDGRIVWADNGNSVNVTLIPKQGESTSGSQISLAAMRALGIPLTALPELIVFLK